MSTSDYYQELKAGARAERQKHGISGFKVMKSDMRRIYKEYGIKIDLWKPHGKPKTLRGAYFCDDIGTSVLVMAGLPYDPFIFTMAHELKHHLYDRQPEGVNNYCSTTNENAPIEIGAEVFAAEFLVPDAEFADWMKANGVQPGQLQPAHLVKLKTGTHATLSYTGLVKKAEFLNFISKGSFKGIRWKKLEEQICGVPFYKRLRGRTRSGSQVFPRKSSTLGR